MTYKSCFLTYTNFVEVNNMRQKARHYRAVERQKAEEELNDLYPISLDYSALGMIAGLSALIGFLFGICLSRNK